LPAALLLILSVVHWTGCARKLNPNDDYRIHVDAEQVLGIEGLPIPMFRVGTAMGAFLTWNLAAEPSLRDSVLSSDWGYQIVAHKSTGDSFPFGTFTMERPPTPTAGPQTYTADWDAGWSVPSNKCGPDFTMTASIICYVADNWRTCKTITFKQRGKEQRVVIIASDAVAAPAITVTDPAATASWQEWSQQTIDWSNSGGPISISYLFYNKDYEEFVSIGTAVGGTSFSWRVPFRDAPSSNAHVRVTSVGPGVGIRGHFPYCSVCHSVSPSTILIASSVNPYNSYTSASICRSVAAIWRKCAIGLRLTADGSQQRGRNSRRSCASL
jgi:hypothetical protein